MKNKEMSVYMHGLFVALTCPCHAITYVYLLSGTTLGAFLFEYEILFMSVLGLAFPFFIFMVVKSYHQFKAQREAEKTGVDCDVSCTTCTPKNG